MNAINPFGVPQGWRTGADLPNVSSSDSVIRGGVPTLTGYRDASWSVGTQTMPQSSSESGTFGDFLGRPTASVGVQTGGLDKSSKLATASAATTGAQSGGSTFLHGLAANAANLASFGITRGLAAADQGHANQVHSANQSAHGVGLQAAVENVDRNQQSKITSGVAGATIGSLLGPLGSLAGYAIGRAVAPQADTPKISGFTGQFSPDSSGVANSHSTQSAEDAPVLNNG